MRRTSSSSPLVFAMAVLGFCALSSAAQAQAASGAKPDFSDLAGSTAAAVAACERAARQTLGAQGARPVEVSFNPSPAVQPRLASDSQTVLRGAGRWRSASGVRTFNYSCDVDLRTFEAVGLVLRDSTVVAEAAPVRPPLEPDLSELSPAACESSAVSALQKRWPLVSKITFDSATRSFRQPSANVAELHGTGLALPAQGSPFTVFEFECAIDPRNGRVLRTSLSG
jgi:hypothetical protein